MVKSESIQYLLAEPNQKNIQLRFGETIPATITQEISSLLDHDVLGLSGQPETFLTPQLQELILENQFNFAPMSAELQMRAQELQQKEVLLLKSGLPKAPDAENYFAAKFAKKNPDGLATPLKEQEVIDLFNQGDISQLIFIQDKFLTPEKIEESLDKVNESLSQALEEISKLREDPFLRSQNIPFGDKKDIPLPKELAESIQKLAVWDIHYRNLRDIARTFYMYQAMTIGNPYPTKAADAEWTFVDDQSKQLMRQRAEDVSKEIYGNLSSELWSNTLYKHLESIRSKDNAESIDALEQKLLPNLSEVKARIDQSEIQLIQRAKENERKESVVERCARFAEAAINTGHTDKLATQNDRLELHHTYSELMKKSGLESGKTQEMLNLYLQTKIGACKDLDELQKIFNPTIDSMVEFLEVKKAEALKKLESLQGKDGEASAALLYQDSQNNVQKFMTLKGERGEAADSLQIQDLIELTSVTENDLNEFSPSESYAEKFDDLEFAQYSRKNAIDIVIFIKDMLADMGIESEIVVGESNKERESTNPKVFKIILTDKGGINVSTIDNNMKVPVARLITAKHMANLFGHEIMAHIGGAKRVADSAAGLINTFSSNGPNEGYAVTLGTTVGALITNPTQEVFDLTETDDSGIDQQLRLVKSKEYSISPEQLNLPLAEGVDHIIALGLHLGFGTETQRGLVEIFNDMKAIYKAENQYLGNNESDVESKAQKSALNLGIIRQARGLWDHVTTKNMSYAVGGLLINQMLFAHENIASLAYGKIGSNHQVYRRIFGLNSDTIDQKWRYINRASLIKHLNIIQTPPYSP